MTHDTCDRCDQPAVTQVTIGIGFGLYCAHHGAEAETARQDRIRAANRAFLRSVQRPDATSISLLGGRILHGQVSMGNGTLMVQFGAEPSDGDE